jgi:GntR family transcriptional regulator/MocR family aminotransferase
MRPVYRRRHDVLLAALAEHVPDARPTGIAAGLHLVAYLPDWVDEESLVRAAAERGVALHALGPYRISHPGSPGLIFGYATLDERAISSGIELLGAVLEAQRP